MGKNGAVHDYECIALACQGGGSLGAYHVGALKAMEECGYSPDAVAGISIGAFTAAIIAGNEPGERVDKLKQFWQMISWPDFPLLMPLLEASQKWRNTFSSLQGFVFGQPAFFRPRFPSPFFAAAGTVGATSFYDTGMLGRTLEQVVGFDRINQVRHPRLILGATRVRDGEPAWFDNGGENGLKIGQEHVIASGAMPPGFPGIRIGGELYWDGGCYSNTPLAQLYECLRDRDTLCFVVDLFGPSGREPRDMGEVLLTAKEIQFSNRLTNRINDISERHNQAHLLRQILQRHPNALAGNPRQAELKRMATASRFDFARILYRKPASEVPTCDCEFSRSSIRKRMEHGYEDMKAALQQQTRLSHEQRPLCKTAAAGSIVNTFAQGNLVESSMHPRPAGVVEGVARRQKRPTRPESARAKTLRVAPQAPPREPSFADEASSGA